MGSIIADIEKISKAVSEDRLSQLRMEEELLLNLVKCKKHSLALKSEAFQRITEVNHHQLKIIGSVFNPVIKRAV